MVFSRVYHSQDNIKIHEHVPEMKRVALLTLAVQKTKGVQERVPYKERNQMPKWPFMPFTNPDLQILLQYWLLYTIFSIIYNVCANIIYCSREHRIPEHNEAIYNGSIIRNNFLYKERKNESNCCKPDQVNQPLLQELRNHMSSVVISVICPV